MKNLLLLLLLANILYFMFHAIRGDEERRSEILIEESQLGPQLQLAENDPAEPDIVVTEPAETGDEASQDEQASDTGVVDSESAPAEDAEDAGEAPPDDNSTDIEPAEDEGVIDDAIVDVDPPAPVEDSGNELQAFVGRSCVTVGAFDRREDADRAQLAFRNEDYETALRSTIGEVVKSHWVHIRDIPSTAEAESMLETLARGGFGEAYKIETEDDGIKITIGFFGKRDGAERVELQVASLGLNPVVAPNVGEGTVYFVDLALPVGKGAQAIIEQYGEDRVALRGAATCP